MRTRTVWAIAAVVAVVLILLLWDYLWVNLIHSGGVDAP